jgi:Cys-rich repeat protein
VERVGEGNVGVVQVDCRDQHGGPVEGVVVTLSICVIPCTGGELGDTQVTGPSGTVMMDAKAYFCLGSYYIIDATYAGQHQQVSVTPNLECYAPVQTFQFNVSPTGCTPPCPTGYQCVNGQCVPLPVVCTSDSQCPTGYHCVNGQCVQIPPIGCTSDSQCPTGFHCVNGQCAAQQQGSLFIFLAITGIGLAAAILLATPRTRR